MGYSPWSVHISQTFLICYLNGIFHNHSKYFKISGTLSKKKVNPASWLTLWFVSMKLFGGKEQTSSKIFIKRFLSTRFWSSFLSLPSSWTTWNKTLNVNIRYLHLTLWSNLLIGGKEQTSSKIFITKSSFARTFSFSLSSSITWNKTLKF